MAYGKARLNLSLVSIPQKMREVMLVHRHVSKLLQFPRSITCDRPFVPVRFSNLRCTSRETGALNSAGLKGGLARYITR